MPGAGDQPADWIVPGCLNIEGRSYRLRDVEDALKLAHA